MKPRRLEPQAGWEQRLVPVAQLLGPTTVLSALLIYFGYVHEWAYYAWFGLSLPTLERSNQELLLSSVAAVYVPLGVLLVAVVLALWAVAMLRRAAVTMTRDRARRIGWCLLVAGALLFARGGYGVFAPEVSRTEPLALTPACLGLGAASIGAGRWILLRWGSRGWVRGDPQERLAAVVVCGLVLLSAFWVVNSTANAQGRGDARSMSRRLSQLPALVMDTKEQLDRRPPGVTETVLPGPTFRHRYRGLRLLVGTRDRMYVVGEGWTPGDGLVLVLRDDDSIRLAFAAPDQGG